MSNRSLSFLQKRGRTAVELSQTKENARKCDDYEMKCPTEGAGAGHQESQPHRQLYGQLCPWGAKTLPLVSLGLFRGGLPSWPEAEPAAQAGVAGGGGFFLLAIAAVQGIGQRD